MENRSLLQPEQLQAYLDRIGLQQPVTADLESLNRLLLAHLTHIPFDSLDIWGAGVCPSLEMGDIYRKLVENRRGGYCFEQNTLFRGALNSLGFDAYQVVACLVNPDGSIQPPAHNVVLCRLDGRKYFLDVGFGGPVPYQALELRQDRQQEFQLTEQGGVYTLLRWEAGEPRPFLRFRDVPVSVTELIPLNFYISQNPTSHFRHIIHVNQRGADGTTRVIEGREFKYHTPQGVVTQPIESIAQLREILETEFQMKPEHLLLRQTL